MPPFPPRTCETVRVDSVIEEHAYLNAYPSPAGPWTIASQTLSSVDGNATDRLLIRPEGDQSTGEEETVAFDVASFVGTPGLVRLAGFTTDYLDYLMRAAAEFAHANAPVHPGSLPRFPVPSARFPDRVDVPLAVLAVDRGRRGLYAPPLVVTLDYPSGEPYGVGPFPGFDPDSWPPPRLGDWPPPAIAGIDRAQLQGMVSRLSACATRLIDAWLAGDDYPHRTDEAAEVRHLLGRLDPPGAPEIYRRLNGDYVRWLEDAA